MRRAAARACRVAACAVLVAVQLGAPACRVPDSERTLALDDAEAARERATTAAYACLADRTSIAGSGETFVLESIAERGRELVLTFRAEHPDWIVRTHDLVTVTYDVASGAVRDVKRH